MCFFLGVNVKFIPKVFRILQDCCLAIYFKKGEKNIKKKKKKPTK